MAQRILIAEDDRGTTHTLTWALRPHFDVVAVGSGGEALGAVKAGQFHLLLVDLRLPDISGLDVIRALRARGEAVPFILASAHVSVPAAVEAMKLGASTVLNTPIDPDDLAAAVRAAMAAPSSALQPLGARRAQPEPVDTLSHVWRDRDAMDRGRTVTSRSRSTAERWAGWVLQLVDAPFDPKTLGSWARLVNVSRSVLCECCRLVRVPPHDARDFARALRAVCRSEDVWCPEAVMDVADTRTLRKLLERGGLLDATRVPTLDEFFRRQQWVPLNNPGLGTLRTLIARTRSTTPIAETHGAHASDYASDHAGHHSGESSGVFPSVLVLCTPPRASHADRQEIDMTPATETLHAAAVTYRPLSTLDEYTAVVALERDVWGPGYDEVVPIPMLKVTGARGGLLLGAFDDAQQLVGYVYALPSLKDGRPALWSYKLGVTDRARNAGVGYGLKLQQRALAIEMGVEVIEWSFDPLQMLYGHLNFTKLGVVVDEYVHDFYGSSMIPVKYRGNPTDRFIASWHIRSPRVGARLGTDATTHAAATARSVAGDGQTALATHVTPHGEWLECRGVALNLTTPRVIAEIPAGFSDMLVRAPDLALSWRLQTREIFTHYLAHGYRVVEFIGDPAARHGAYVLERVRPASADHED